MIEFNFEDLLRAKPSLDKILNKEFPLKVSYKLSKLVHRINEELKFFEESRSKLLKKYADGEKPDENGNIKIPVENSEKFAEKFNELLSINIQINEDVIVDINQLPDNIELSPIDMNNLSFFIKG